MELWSRLVREFIMLEFEVGQRIGIADILDGYVLNESHILSPILRCSGSPTCRFPEAHDEALLPEDLYQASLVEVLCDLIEIAAELVQLGKLRD